MTNASANMRMCDFDNYIECWTNERSGSSTYEKCWDDTQVLDQVLTWASAIIIIFVVAPAVIWKMSKCKEEKEQGTVKEQAVFTRAVSANAKASGPTGETGVNTSVTLIQTAQLVTVLLSHVQIIVILCLLVDLHVGWPAFVKQGAEWIRQLVFLDLELMEVLKDTTCSRWRGERDAAYHNCGLTDVSLDHAFTEDGAYNASFTAATACVERIPNALVGIANRSWITAPTAGSCRRSLLV